MPAFFLSFFLPSSSSSSFVVVVSTVVSFVSCPTFPFYFSSVSCNIRQKGRGERGTQKEVCIVQLDTYTLYPTRHSWVDDPQVGYCAHVKKETVLAWFLLLAAEQRSFLPHTF